MMTKYQIERTARFKKDYKLIKKRGYDVKLLQDVVSILAKGEPLPEKYLDHPLKGDYKGCRECHITPAHLCTTTGLVHAKTLLIG
jgi:mRNA interferase YafQ